MTHGTDNIFASGKHEATYNPATGEVLTLACEKGLTKREIFAAMALQGFCANPDVGTQVSGKVAEYAVDQADALIEALNQ